jgi:hypothetical protein
MTVFPTLRGLRQEDSKFKVSLGYKKKGEYQGGVLGGGNCIFECQRPLCSYVRALLATV